MRAYNNMISSTTLPVLVKGGPSSSSTLNRIHSNIREDIVHMNLELQEREREQRMVAAYLDAQTTGFQGLVNHLDTITPAAPSGRGIVDFFNSDAVHANNTAEVDQDYGQCTLPVLSTQEKAHYLDQNGVIWIPDDSRIRTYISGYLYTTMPDDDLFLTSTEDYRGISGNPTSFFLGGQLEAEKFIYLKLTLPTTLNIHRLCNRITFKPLPAFSHSLVGAYIRKTDATWNALDLTYLPQYEALTIPQASLLGPVRLHFPPTEVTEVCMVLKGTGWYGVQEFTAQLVEYNTAANIVVDFTSYSPTTISTTILGGMNSGNLQTLPVTVDGSVVTVPISLSSAYTTPVITSVEARW